MSFFNKLFSLIFITIIFVFTLSCDFNSMSDELPSLTTKTPRFVSHNGAFCGGEFIEEPSNVEEKGICWSVNPDPTIADSHSGNNYGDTFLMYFDVFATDLSPNTTYHMRAYCTNPKGTAYGNDVTFTTISAPPSTFTDKDGNVYDTIVIGNQTWLKQNLKVEHYNDGSAITLCTDISQNATSERYMRPNNDINNVAVYGLLYNYYAYTNPKGIAPEGWHVPTDEEYAHLGYSTIGGIYDMPDGNKLKEAGTAHWMVGSEGTNESGFTALPASNGYNIGGDAFFATVSLATDEGNNMNYVRHMTYLKSTVFVTAEPYYSFSSVRLVRDYAE